MKDDSDDDRWTHIRCLVVTTLTDDQQTRLLGQAHLHGKTEWSPYAKALFCFRWVVEERRDISTLAGLSGFSPAEIKKNVKIIELMQENDDNALSNFSYYNVLVRSRTISSASRKIANHCETRLLSQIKTEAFTAQEMRERLPTDHRQASNPAKIRERRRDPRGRLRPCEDQRCRTATQEDPRRPGRHRKARRHRTLWSTTNSRPYSRSSGKSANA